jgi:tetratricopeptide (TPR) repeat protein
VLQERYAEATAALSKGDYTTAIAAFEAIVADQADYQDAAEQLATARRLASQEAARRDYEAGVQAEAGGNHVAAVQHLERALKADRSLTEAQDLMRTVRERMRIEGEDAYKRAKQYDALGRTTEAIAMYEKAVQMLAADHPLRASARERLDALRGIK